MTRFQADAYAKFQHEKKGISQRKKPPSPQSIHELLQAGMTLYKGRPDFERLKIKRQAELQGFVWNQLDVHTRDGTVQEHLRQHYIKYRYLYSQKHVLAPVARYQYMFGLHSFQLRIGKRLQKLAGGVCWERTRSVMAALEIIHEMPLACCEVCQITYELATADNPTARPVEPRNDPIHFSCKPVLQRLDALSQELDLHSRAHDDVPLYALTLPELDLGRHFAVAFDVLEQDRLPQPVVQQDDNNNPSTTASMSIPIMARRHPLKYLGLREGSVGTSSTCQWASKIGR